MSVSFNILARNYSAFPGWNFPSHIGWTGALHDHVGIRGLAAKEAREESGGKFDGTVGRQRPGMIFTKALILKSNVLKIFVLLGLKSYNV